MLRPRLAWGAVYVIGAVAMLCAWEVAASFLYCTLISRPDAFVAPWTQWLSVAPWWRTNWFVTVAVIASGAGPLLPFVIIAVMLCRLRTPPAVSLRPSLFSRAPRDPARAASDNHGHARWMTMDEASRTFPGPAEGYGGVVVGEAYRVDQDRVADAPFDPADRSTWGQGGKAELLIDPCTSGPTHSITFAGSGSFKTTSAVSTLLTWTGSAVILDPSCELGPMLTKARRSMRHSVFSLGLDTAHETGVNVLDWIDTASPKAPSQVHAVVAWICGENPRKGASSANQAAAFFSGRARSLIACLLAHLLWDDTIKPELRNLRTLRAAVAKPEKDMRKLLDAIHRTSNSAMARDLAATLKGTVDETFSGILSNAAEDSAWLANPAFASLVSGNSLRTADVAAGRITVFLQIPMDVMLNTPGLARVLVGAFLNAAYQSDGGVNGRILFLLDEAARLGPMSVLKQARDAGRKYGITLALYLQSTGQLLDTWGRDGAREWYDGVSWRAYAAIADLDTAREISAMVGKYGVLATSEGVNRGLSRRFTEAGSRSRGSNQSFHEISRDLVRPEELINDMRVDDQIVIPRGGRPLRCGRAIYFRRPEFAARVQANRFASRRAA